MPGGRSSRPPGNDPGIRWVRLAVLVCALTMLYLLGRWIADSLVQHFGMVLLPHNEPLLHRAVMTATVVYILLMAVPFMPAVEIGLSMLLIFGAKIALLVYLSTVLALTLAFALGRVVAAEHAAKLFGLLGLTRAGGYVSRLAPLSAQERMDWLTRESPAMLVPLMVRHRYLVLAALLNLPGNAVIGGGGGIALVAGMTRLFPFPAYLLTILLAVAPVPLIVFLAG